MIKPKNMWDLLQMRESLWSLNIKNWTTIISNEELCKAKFIQRISNNLQQSETVEQFMEAVFQSGLTPGVINLMLYHLIISWTLELETIVHPFSIFSASSSYSALMIMKPVKESFPKGSPLVPVTIISLPPWLKTPLTTFMSAIDSNHLPHALIYSDVGFSNQLCKIR